LTPETPRTPATRQGCKEFRLFQATARPPRCQPTRRRAHHVEGTKLTAASGLLPVVVCGLARHHLHHLWCVAGGEKSQCLSCLLHTCLRSYSSPDPLMGGIQVGGTEVSVLYTLLHDTARHCTPWKWKAHVPTVHGQQTTLPSDHDHYALPRHATQCHAKVYAIVVRLSL